MTDEEKRRAFLNLRGYVLKFAELLGEKSVARESYRRMNQVLGAAYFVTGIVGLKGDPCRAFLDECLDTFTEAMDEKERLSVLGTLRSILLEQRGEEIDLAN